MKVCMTMLCVFSVWIGIKGDGAEYELYRKLLHNYSKLGRPTVNFSDPLPVTLGVALQQIADVNWNDYNLSWDPEDFAGITDLRFRRDDLWTPDVLLYNSAQRNFDPSFASNVIVYSDGSVSWIPPGIFRSSCRMDISYFPFDTQTCTLKFGSWSYNMKQLDLQPLDAKTGIDTSEYLVNGEWTYRSGSVTVEHHDYSMLEGRPVEPYVALSFSMTIVRRQTYFLLNVIFPAVLISFMAMLGFYLPPDSGERMSIGMTVMLSVTLFMSMLSEMTPKTSESTPLIGSLFAACLWLSALSVMVSIFVLNLNQGGHIERMSPWTHSIFIEWLPWLLRLDALDQSTDDTSEGDLGSTEQLLRHWTVQEENKIMLMEESVWEKRASDQAKSGESGLVHATPYHYGKPQKMVRQQHKVGIPMQTKKPVTHLAVTWCLRSLVEKVSDELQQVTLRMRRQDEEDNIELEWLYAAMVMDKTCLYLFTGTFFAVIAGFAYAVPEWNP